MIIRGEGEHFGELCGFAVVHVHSTTLNGLCACGPDAARDLKNAVGVR
jgi:hypothetical protein